MFKHIVLLNCQQNFHYMYRLQEGTKKHTFYYTLKRNTKDKQGIILHIS
jgi:hypothetical protein